MSGFIFLFYLAIFAFGLVIGSFLNCVIYRLGEKKSFLRGRSFCPKCKKKLAWHDLIPVLSYLLLRGRCRYCKKTISLQYPLVELGTAILFVLVFKSSFPFISFFSFLSFIYYLFISSILVVIFVYDLKHFLVLDKVIFPAIALALLYNLFDVHGLIYSLLPAACGASLFFFVIFFISKGKWLGFGDVKLAFFLGLILGIPGILIGLFLSFLIGAIIGIGLIILKGKNLKTEVPFAPFLVLGTFIALFWGKEVINWYISLIIS